MDDEREMPLLGAIAACLRWVEELVVLVSGPMLTVGLGIGLVSLLSDGALLVSAPWLLYAWAISQTVGVDGQLVGTWYRVSVAVSKRRWGVVCAFIVLGVALAYVGYIGALVFAMQQSYHLTTGQALARLGMNATTWLWQRAAVSVFLVCLSGYLRYRAPRQDTRTLAEKRQALHDQMELEALRQQQQAQRLRGAVGLVRGAVAAASARDAAPPPSVDDTDSDPDSDTDGQAAAPREGVSAASAPPLSSASSLPMRWPRQPVATASANQTNHHTASSESASL